ncbi:hypothetical protein EVAR_93440_1 [Eumeta japonica]|uniref:Uncharacterized protein n=1 Tax=Eumeta variegata TaxID=151549 RepID=A0A4C1TMJ0_EUMVA|nr:hypothetical protein EVAR_93440_1 [Eumeta japonica]
MSHYILRRDNEGPESESTWDYERVRNQKWNRDPDRERDSDDDRQELQKLVFNVILSSRAPFPPLDGAKYIERGPDNSYRIARDAVRARAPTRRGCLLAGPLLVYEDTLPIIPPWVRGRPALAGERKIRRCEWKFYKGRDPDSQRWRVRETSR